MAIPEFVNQKLRQTFGAEATEFIVTWMDDIDRQRGDINELRRDVQGDIAELRHKMQGDIADLRREMHVGFARLETAIERSRSDLMKWSFVFWVGAVIAIALLAKVIP
ncbi:MAG: hypothetical protein ACRENU_04405 [Gemmatimonadaceae bacterium]